MNATIVRAAASLQHSSNDHVYWPTGGKMYHTIITKYDINLN